MLPTQPETRLLRRGLHLSVYSQGVPSPDMIIWGLIAIAVVLLWPIRNWTRRRYDRDGHAGNEDPDAGNED